jgi:Fe-S-cluster-containing dehydrogenase component
MPLYDGRSAYELLAAMQGQTSQSSYDTVRAFWQTQHIGADFEQFWRRALHDGVLDGTAFGPIQVQLSQSGLPPPSAPTQPAGALELIFRPDHGVWDGRFANNGWLQELPRPLTSLTWDNAALIAPATAARLGLAQEDVVELRYHGRVVRAPVLVMPGHPDDAVTIALGYGRTRAGRVGSNTGFNAYAIRTSDAPWFGGGLELAKTADRHPLADTAHHFGMQGRDLLRVGTLADFRQNPHFATATEPAETAPKPPALVPGEDLPSLYPSHEYTGHRWGMSIDLNACIGCQACTVACQAENNIPVVGKQQVLISREMHWLKVDRYYEGDPSSPAAYFQPRPCMQCEKAPCELVCPVAATTHSAEGLNDMVYNRCVGTRYCSNNCPYKVRRFNFFQYADETTPVIKLLYNPDVTVRDRGVMEKCTYCVQRINAGNIEAEKAGQPIRDGAIKTACQEACPTQAIVFGDINDTSSQVAQLKASPLSYGMLAELDTQPRTTYLAKLRNPNAEIG